MYKTIPAKLIPDLGLLFFLSLVIRSLWLKLGAWMQFDSPEYLLLARNLVTHGAFSLADNAETLTAHRPPLFPAMISALWHGDTAPVTEVLIANVILGSLTVCLTYLIAWDRFNRRTALVAAVMLAFGPMTCLFTVTILTETLFTFLVAAAVFLWGRGLFAGSGAAFGLSALTRPSILPFLAALPLLAIFPSFRRFWRGYMMILAIGIIVASGWIMRNAIAFDRFILVASSGWGTNLLCGTLETDTGGRVWNGEAWAPLDLKTNPVTRVDGVTDETEIDRIRMKRAMSRIGESPAEWLVVRAKQYPKLFLDNGDYLLGARNLPLREAFGEWRLDVILVKALFLTANLAVLLLALYGIFSLLPRLADHAHIVLFPVFGMLIHLPAWIEPRYFLPMMPMMFILAAVGMERLSFLSRLFPRLPEPA